MVTIGGKKGCKTIKETHEKMKDGDAEYSLLVNLKRSQVQPPHHAKRSPIFKWRRVEGRDHYPPSLEGYDCSKGWVTDGFLDYQKNKDLAETFVTSEVLMTKWATLYLKLWNSPGTIFIFLISKRSALLNLIESFLTTKSPEGLCASQLACRVSALEFEQDFLISVVCFLELPLDRQAVED
ncbi:hypothetical protein H5410_021411 [Solanum commersonii]|uniref:Uncharacterized protein n=1 Tax=Solanum commersonii TaxID=4109 RepID=A0A9J5ZBX3_SOLCO|nr:hypothetical protein H5410_021411 [Solanum commersonii]